MSKLGKNYIMYIKCIVFFGKNIGQKHWPRFYYLFFCLRNKTGVHSIKNGVNDAYGPVTQGHIFSSPFFFVFSKITVSQLNLPSSWGEKIKKSCWTEKKKQSPAKWALGRRVVDKFFLHSHTLFLHSHIIFFPRLPFMKLHKYHLFRFLKLWTGWGCIRFSF